ncbi:oligosaccharide biosynthesis protein Alg14-like protein [Aspergillus crustosus]
MELLQLPLSWLLAWLGFCAVLGLVTMFLLLRALAISQNNPVPRWRPQRSPVHLLVVLGSGGHTAEMLSMLRRMKLDPAKYTYRTYVVSSGDHFSASKAVEFESSLKYCRGGSATYCVVTVPRARRVHQSYFTAPFTTLQSFWSCLFVLRGLHPDQKQQGLTPQLPSPYPDLILTNGPATAVCVVLAAKLLRMGHILNFLFPAKERPHPRSVGRASTEENSPLSEGVRLRTIFVESWARVKTLSLSGKIMLPLADRFLVQWPALEGRQAWPGMRKTEYVGPLVE